MYNNLTWSNIIGLSLTTRSGSAIMINPPIPEASQLQQRNCCNKNRLKILMFCFHIQMKEMMRTGKPTWVREKLSLPPQERNFTFTRCANCSKPIDAYITYRSTVRFPANAQQNIHRESVLPKNVHISKNTTAPQPTNDVATF
ncbi:hypothetical protein LXL04_020934 [Taraxacum kok-saghyz]